MIQKRGLGGKISAWLFKHYISLAFFGIGKKGIVIFLPSTISMIGSSPLIGNLKSAHLSSHRVEINGGRGYCPQYWPVWGKSAPPLKTIWDWGKILGAKPPKFGAVGAVLENFKQIFEKSGLNIFSWNSDIFKEKFHIFHWFMLHLGFLDWGAAPPDITWLGRRPTSPHLISVPVWRGYSQNRRGAKNGARFSQWLKLPNLSWKCYISQLW